MRHLTPRHSQRLACPIPKQEDDIDALLEKGKRVQLHSSGAGGAFSKACFSSSEEGPAAKLDVDDPLFWQKVLPKDRQTGAKVVPEVTSRRSRRMLASDAYEDAGSSAIDSDDGEYELSLSDCEAQLAARKKGERRPSSRVVLHAVGKRVYVLGSGSDKHNRVSGVYLDDGKVELDADCAIAHGLTRDETAPDMLELGVSARAPVSVTLHSFCQLAGNRNHKPLQYVRLEDCGTSLQELDDPEGAAAGLYRVREACSIEALELSIRFRGVLVIP